MLASALQRQNRADEAIGLLRMTFDQAIEAPLAPGALNQLFSAMMPLDMMLRQKNQTGAADENLQQVINTVKAEQQTTQTANANTQLLMNVYAFAARTADRPTAEAWFQGELERVEGLYRAEPENSFAMTAYLNALVVTAFPVYDAGRAHEENVQKLLDVAPQMMSKHLDSAQVLAGYQSAMTRVINSLMRDDPKRAEEILQQVKTLLGQAKEKQANPAVAERALQTLAGLEPRIAAALKQLAMIGTPAPALDALAWANGQAGSLGDLQGKVVLLDFWAVWCGPCIATFPHLREWHDQYSSQGLAIVGVTRQYNYAWDDEAKGASKAEGEVALDDELKMLEKFIAHHELRHPTLVTPAGSTMQTEYGVTGIPHAVLIDKQGRVRMIKVGSGQANAEALHQMIETLLAE
jgi:thiol-disulfide isomerase/thioredoxin